MNSLYLYEALTTVTLLVVSQLPQAGFTFSFELQLPDIGRVSLPSSCAIEVTEDCSATNIILHFRQEERRRTACLSKNSIQKLTLELLIRAGAVLISSCENRKYRVFIASKQVVLLQERKKQNKTMINGEGT